MRVGQAGPPSFQRDQKLFPLSPCGPAFWGRLIVEIAIAIIQLFWVDVIFSHSCAISWVTIIFHTGPVTPFPSRLEEKRKLEGLKKMDCRMALIQPPVFVFLFFLVCCCLGYNYRRIQALFGCVKSFFFDLNGQTWPKKRRENKTSSSPFTSRTALAVLFSTDLFFERPHKCGGGRFFLDTAQLSHNRQHHREKKKQEKNSMSDPFSMFYFYSVWHGKLSREHSRNSFLPVLV